MNAFRLRVASDVGGTFTDNVVYDEATKRVTVAKVPTTPENRALGTVQGLLRALEAQGRAGADVGYVGHGMTTATNAVIQRKGGRTAFITNEGFRDLLLIGRQDRPSLYDIRQTRPPPLVPREDCHTVRGRMDPLGREVTPLDEEGLRAVAALLQQDKIEAVAICFLHAYANPAHERRAKAILAAALPGVPVCASTDILAEFREYERTSTVVLNAFLMPIMEHYLASLTELLADPAKGLGIAAEVPVMIMEASGGLMTVATARERPVHTVLSGPAGGVVASAHVAALSGFPDIITMDMGGTSTDISLILGGVPQVTREASLERTPIRIPVIDINAIGAGGGSIAWIDDGGALRVGPMSAEAIPGPACYGRGGTQPTVTDANLVLGYLSADAPLGGGVELDPEAARSAVGELAEQLGLDLEACAEGIRRVAGAEMLRALRVVTVQRGIDPRRYGLMAFGGAGGLHAAQIADELEIDTVLCPRASGVLAALGLVVSPRRRDVQRSVLWSGEELNAEAIAGAVKELGERAREAMHVPDADLRVVYELRYRGQSFELPIPGPSDATPEKLREAFESEHEERYGYRDDEQQLELVTIRVTATAEGAEVELASASEESEELERSSRQATLDGEPVELEVLRGIPGPGTRVEGPAVIELPESTLLVPPGWTVEVDDTGTMTMARAR
jgi:N-methylhydantoinase A